METITFKGNPIHLKGEFPRVSSKLPDFTLTNKDLKPVSLKDFDGKKKLISIFPSIDTPVCAESVKKFNAHAANRDVVIMLMVSADLPFAQSRFCSTQNADKVITLSMMRDAKFAEDYGVLIKDGPLAGIAARAVLVADGNNQVLYSELVSELSQEPNYDGAISALSM